MKNIFLISFLLLHAFAVCQTNGASGPASMFRGAPEHAGAYDAPGVPQFSRVKWKFHTGGKVFSSPAVAGDTIYVGSTDQNLYAINLENGSLKWKFPTHSRVTSSPAIADGTVYIGSMDGNFYAVDAATGKQKWRLAHPGERRFAAKHIHGVMPAGETMPDPFDFFSSSPTVSAGVVYIGSGDGNIYALDAASGALKWKFQTGDVVHASPAVSDGTVFAGSWDSYFYALNAATGKERWRFKTGEDHEIANQQGIQSSAMVADGMVYFGCRDSNFYALDAKSGEKKWAFNNKGSWVITSPAYRDGKVYFATSDTGLFYEMDAKTGAKIFSLSFVWPMFSSPAIAGNTLYIGSHLGKLFTVNLVTKQPGWSFETDGYRENGAQYTGPDGKPNYAMAYGREDFYDALILGIEKLFSVGAVLSSPVVDKDVVYFGSADGNLYALM